MVVLFLLTLLSLIFIADATIRVLEGICLRDGCIIAINVILIFFLFVNVYSGIDSALGVTNVTIP